MLGQEGDGLPVGVVAFGRRWRSAALLSMLRRAIVDSSHVGCRPKFDQLKERDECLPSDLTVADDCGQQARADGFARVNRHNGSAAVCMTKKVVAALHPGDFEPRLPQSRNDLSSRDPREARHATVIF